MKCLSIFSLQTTQEYLTRIDRWLQKEWRNLYDVFIQRKQSGYVRECHGDLHLGNIAVFEGDVCVFDALEFEPRLRWIDVMSEVAFLYDGFGKTWSRGLSLDVLESIPGIDGRLRRSESLSVLPGLSGFSSSESGWVTIGTVGRKRY